jgi:hypothetical protein
MLHGEWGDGSNLVSKGGSFQQGLFLKAFARFIPSRLEAVQKYKI